MRAFNWGSQEGEDKHGTRLGTPDTGYTLAEAEICNVLEHKDKLNKSFVIQIFGHLQFEGESHFRPHEMACNKFCSFNLTLSSQFAMRLMV